MGLVQMTTSISHQVAEVWSPSMLHKKCTFHRVLRWKCRPRFSTKDRGAGRPRSGLGGDGKGRARPFCSEGGSDPVPWGRGSSTC